MIMSDRIVFDPEVGGGAAAPAAAAPAADGLAAAAAAAQPPAAAAPPGVQTPPTGQPVDWFPKGLDETFKGKDPAETLTRLAEHMGKLPKPPADAKAYEFKPDAKLEPFMGRSADAAVIDVAKGVAHELGLSNDQFGGFINKFYATAIEKGLLDAPVDVAAEFTKLGGTAGDTAAKLDAGQKRVLAVVDGINALATRNELTAEEAAGLRGMLGDANVVMAAEKLLARIGGGGPVNGGQGGGQVDAEAAQTRRMYPSMFQN